MNEKYLSNIPGSRRFDPFAANAITGGYRRSLCQEHNCASYHLYDDVGQDVTGDLYGRHPRFDTEEVPTHDGILLSSRRQTWIPKVLIPNLFDNETRANEN